VTSAKCPEHFKKTVEEKDCVPQHVFEALMRQASEVIKFQRFTFVSKNDKILQILKFQGIVSLCLLLLCFGGLHHKTFLINANTNGFMFIS